MPIKKEITLFTNKKVKNGYVIQVSDRTDIYKGKIHTIVLRTLKLGKPNRGAILHVVVKDFETAMSIASLLERFVKENRDNLSKKLKYWKFNEHILSFGFNHRN